ncbi:hypothetical protein AB0J35_37185 [Nonomuraea angiospora]|uniref:hypothetical protein n=1 Tax=Nonomuraea angiospora TaxID=46172 RepID=UPI00343F458F
MALPEPDEATLQATRVVCAQTFAIWRDHLRELVREAKTFKCVLRARDWRRP